MADSKEEEIRIPTVFIGAEDAPIQFANQFVIQHQQEEFVLTIAQVVPPILLGTPEEKIEQAKQTAYVPIKVIGRYGMTRPRVEELIKALQDNLDNFDKGKK